jgi:cytosine/adenosine deaminase-related metal-dependent hydrolase
MKVLRARHVYDGARWISPGEIVWDEAGAIVAIRRAPRGARIRDLAVVPGLVNAHAHLQLDAVGRAPSTFVGWVGQVMAARGRTSPAAMVASAVRSLRELLDDGCTAVGEIDSSGLSQKALLRVPFAGRCYQEVTGFHLDAAAAKALVAARRSDGTPACLGGMSPHAPYSVSASLFRACRSTRQPLSVHAAELPEEQQFLRQGTGPFRELLERLGRLPAGFRAPKVGAIRWLEQLGLLRPTTLLVHCQELERGDAARIADAGAPIVVCPGTMLYFGRRPPQVPDWLRRGIPVALGTDSRASNESMSMRSELTRAAAMWPSLRPAELFAMATTHGAPALHRKGLGRLRKGQRADFFAVQAGEQSTDVILADFVHGKRAPVATWLAGRMHRCRAKGGSDG